ncbi:MAG: POTRA domain-containing protein [Ignavibacteriaceae bacterium]
MLLRIKLFISLLLFLYISVYPQIITSVNFNGNDIFSTGNLLEWSGIQGSKYFAYAEDTIKSRISYQLGLRGYFYPQFGKTETKFSSDSARVTLNLQIDEGTPAYINSVTIEGDSVLTERLISSFEFLEGNIFNKSEIEENIAEVLTHLENTGYPFARILIQSVYIFTDSAAGEHYADILLKVNRDIKSKIDKIEIAGNTTTKEYVIIRELRLEPGEDYSQQKIEELPERLNRLRFFEPVTVPEYYINADEEGVLLINIKEKQTNNFDGIIGYVPAVNEGEKGYLTGLVNVSLRNLFGTGRAAAIRWQQFNRNSQELELRFLEPWLFGFPFNLSGRLFQRKQDTTYVQRNLEGTFVYLATENISAAVTVSTEEVIPAGTNNPFFTVYNSSAVTTGLTLIIDTRDDPYAPLGGILFNTSYSLSRKKINGPQQFIYPGLETSINLQRITLDLSGFYELFSRQVIALGLHTRELRGSFFEISDLYRLGGTNTLRGYREDQFLGSRTFWSNLEYRFLLTRRSFAFLFFDTGYYLRNADPDRNILKQEAFNMGYGLGLNIETALGVLSVSFALAEGNSFTDGLIHFGIVNEF